MALKQLHLKIKFNGPPAPHLRGRRDIEEGPPTEDLLGLTDDPMLSDDEGNATVSEAPSIFACRTVMTDLI